MHTNTMFVMLPASQDYYKQSFPIWEPWISLYTTQGVSHMVGLKKYDFEKDQRTMEINLIGALAWLNPIAAMFQEMGAGQIVGISSVAGERGRVGNPSYNASKAALSSYLESLRNRLSRHGVNVLTVKPGFVDTDLLAGAKKTF